MRVIAGSAGGIPLHTPRTDLRPTMDRVKAAIFSSLGDKIIGAHVVDLFAGTGALGIEALSRGAASAVFVENDVRAAETIKRNLEKTRLAGSAAMIQQSDIFSYLDRLTPQRKFDLVFADPPYVKKPGERDFAPELLHAPSFARSLASEGIFVLEKMPDQKLKIPECWELIRVKKYGATEVAFFQLIPSPPAASE